MKQLVDDIVLAEAARVKDDRLTPLVVGEDSDEAVADSAELVAHRKLGDPLRPDLVLVEVEPALPAPDEDGFLCRPDHWSLSPSAAATRSASSLSIPA
jgi:hypothetical protein